MVKIATGRRIKPEFDNLHNQLWRHMVTKLAYEGSVHLYIYKLWGSGGLAQFYYNLERSKTIPDWIMLHTKIGL